MSHLTELQSHMTSSPYHVITLPSHTPPSAAARLHDYHIIIERGDNRINSHVHSSEEIKLIVNKVRSLLPKVRANIYDSQEERDSELETILHHAHVSLHLVQGYLQGDQPYTASVGQTVTSIITNQVPETWYSSHAERGRSLVEFIQWIRQLYYY